jgi:tetratricopeptide (TPR) repeat protein
MDTSFNRRASKLIARGRLSEARALLEAAIQKMPNGWTPTQEDDLFLKIAFWDEEEFLAHSDREVAMNRLTKSIAWVDGSYSQAWNQLAVVASKEGRYVDALFCVDRGIELEPDHPELWCEKGYILGWLKRYQEAFDCYVHAASVRDWAPPSHVARALRGQGVTLIDLGRLDEAEQVLRKSLAIEPHSEVAHNELNYIQDLRQTRKAEEIEIPWFFLHSLAHPPADPLTLRLLALVEDLPPIPGPQTVGSEEYSRVADAFLTRGWAGFEEEFDRIVPRARADYAEVKRDLLREPIFNRKTHQNMADALLGTKTFEEIWDEIARKSKQKPN